MTTINEAKRLIKRVLLANVACGKQNLSITPLVSGRHGIGKSQMIKSIAADLGGFCITIEGGTLKEGEITGLPYQYTDEDGKVGFRFLPYYAVDRIQKEEERLFALAGKSPLASSVLAGDENRFAMNDLTPAEKIDCLLEGRVRPVIVFIDEINRTENTVYKELMNILLTRSVNGYEFPWWVFFVGAMNPSTQTSMYATNEMDPAQLDRFIKIKVDSNAREWLRYGRQAGISPEVLTFIKENPKCLTSDDAGLDDEEKPTPSPRGWEMVDVIMSSEPHVRDFFTSRENDPKVVERDMKSLVSAKLGASVATMFFASRVEKARAIMPEELLADDEELSKHVDALKAMSAAKKLQTCDLMLAYLKENIDFMMLDKHGFETMKKQLAAMIRCFDSSTKLLFAQNIAATTTDDGSPLIELLFDVFGSDLIGMLDLSDQTRKLIEESS